MNAIFKYPGSKWAIAKGIVNTFPRHHAYLEPYFGSGVVLFNKQPSHIETVNDLDGDIVNVFRWIREDPQRLARELYMIPFSRQVYEETFDRYGKVTDPLQRAVDFLIRMMQGHGFRTTGERVGWKYDKIGRERAYAAYYWGALPGAVVDAAERLKEVQIEHRPALEVIKLYRHEDVLIYADPPYLLSTRNRKQYLHEMTEQDHVELLEALLDHPGPVALSGYESDMYDQYLKGWKKLTFEARAQNSGARTEVLWTNYDPWGKYKQMEMF